MARTIFGFVVALALSAGCTTPHRPGNTAPKKDYYDFAGQTTETWRVEIVNPPVPDADLEVFYHPKGAPYGMLMKHVPGHPYLFQADAPRGTPISFTVEAVRGTKPCGSRQVKNRFEYCGQVRVSSNAPNPLNPEGKPDHFEGQRYQITGIMTPPEGETASWSCQDGPNLYKGAFTIPGGLNHCTYLSFFYQ